MIENFEIKNLKEELKLFENKDFKEIFWHTSSHILAQAVKRLFPEVQLAIGQAIENGFYYDFDIDTPFSPEDIEKIEKEMNKIVDERLEIKRVEMSSQEAKKLMEEKQEIYKIELIEALESKGENISLYSQGEFIDLCAGPHLPNTSYVKSIKLLQSTGAYWHGDAKNKMLTRIYGISFPKNSMLKDYLDKLEEAKRRDHRKIGKDLELFALLDEGKGFPFFLPKGMVIRNILEDFWREEHKKAGYVEIKTPVILNEDLWKRSGHWAHYKDNMYTTKIDEQEHAIKPMNCPGGMLVFKTKLHSYRDLPIRMAELGLVHRHELSGALHGLMRVRCFTQDDAHIFMTESQIESEIIGVMNLIDNFYSTFGFKYYIELSTRPSDSMGSDEQWEAATTALKNALDKTNKKYKINEGDGAFYGPKIDFHLEDSIGRTWQCGTVQLDFQMPEKFDLSYISETGEKQRPVMIHRVVFGSIERFIGILTEHFAGDFPLWIAPLQCKILPISQAHHEAAHKIFKNLELAGLRAELDERNEKIGYKIREAQLQKIPYMIIIGDKEITENKISVRSKKLGDLGSISLEDFINKISEEIKNKSF